MPQSKFDWSGWDEARKNTQAMGNYLAYGSYIKPEESAM